MKANTEIHPRIVYLNFQTYNHVYVYTKFMVCTFKFIQNINYEHSSFFHFLYVSW